MHLERLGTIAALLLGACLPKVDFTPCAQRSNCPTTDVADSALEISADQPTTPCPSGGMCDVLVDIGADHGECAPPCRSGFTCIAGSCVSSCNPACAETERCDVHGGVATCIASPPSDIGIGVEAGADVVDGAVDALDANDALSDSDLTGDTSHTTDGSDVALIDAPDDGRGDASDVARALDASDVIDVTDDVCAAPRTICGASCVDTRTDNSNCGVCSRVCSSGQRCVTGVCSCPSGTSLCDFNCVDLLTDNDNCGICSRLCSPTGQTCVSGFCVCPPGLTACGRGAFTCADLQTSSAHCGACGNACPSTQVCRAGRCVTP